MPSIRIWTPEYDYDRDAVCCLAKKIVKIEISYGTKQGFNDAARIPNGLKKAVDTYLKRNDIVIFLIDADSASQDQRRKEKNSLLNRIQEVVNASGGKAILILMLQELEAWLLVDCLGICCYYTKNPETRNREEWIKFAKRQQGKTNLLEEAELGGNNAKEYLEELSRDILIKINPNLRTKPQNLKERQYTEDKSPEIAEWLEMSNQTIKRNESLEEFADCLKQLAYNNEINQGEIYLNMPKKFAILTLNIENLDERGYGIAQHGNKIVQVLNALPGETVEAQIFRRKKGGLQGVAKSVLKASNLRVSPREDHFLCCSPWQILDFEAENQIKASSIKKFYQEVKINLPDFDIISLPDQTWNYRNKAEFSFYSDETEQLNLAFFGRDSRSKYPHTGCVLMAEPINLVGRRFLDLLNGRKIQARQLKSLILRYCYAQNKVVACLFFKDETLSFNPEELSFLLDEVLQGVSIIYSTHKSPAPVVTEIRHQLGCLELTESIYNVNLTYNWDNFFQINPPVFELAAKDLVEQIKATPDFSNLPVVEMYAGIGTLGLLVAPLVPKVLAVEVTPGSQERAIRNAAQNRVGNFEFIESLAEESVSAIASNQILILDPPRVGLHNKVIEKIMAESPKHIVYLSCNPKTQAANYAALQEKYKIRWMRAYNFYPHTPHIESLLVLDKR